VRDSLEIERVIIVASMLLKILLTLYIVYALVKFFDFFYSSYDRRIAGLRSAYQEGGHAIKLFDNVILVVMALFVVLLFASGMEYLSFITGLLVGMTLIQVYFHRFIDPLPPDKAPKPPVSAIKLMSYAIQANPEKAWRELLFMTVLLLWGLYMLLTRGFGLFT
jgi:hypothetical protein